MSEMVHLYDIIQEESATLDDGITPIQDKKSVEMKSPRSLITCSLTCWFCYFRDAQCSGSSAAAAAEESVITCNSTRMIREKVAPKVKGQSSYGPLPPHFTSRPHEKGVRL